MKYIKITLLLLLITNSGYAQDYQSKMELEKQIIGSWHLENNAQERIIFFKDGTVERYNGNELRSAGKYEITDNCEGEKLSNENFFLEEISENGISSCYYIESINYNNNGIFSLMTKNQGKIVVYKRVQKRFRE